MDAIGTDIKLNGGDLSYTSDGDLNVVSSLYNLWQATYVRITTTLGTNLFVKDYGTQLGKYVDEPLTGDLQDKIVTELKNTVLQDSRIKAISNIQVTEQDNGYTVSFTIIAATGGTISGSIPIGG